MVAVNTTQCERIGALITDLTIRPEFFTREFLNIQEDRETCLRVYLFSAAICHQTHQLHHPAKNLWGWEYMEYGFLKMIKHNRALLNPRIISVCSPEEVKEQLLLTFSPDGTLEGSTFDRIDERVGMLQEICRDVSKNYDGKISKLIDQTGGFLINKGLGLYELLGKYMGFDDPLKKKITFFIKLATEANVLNIKDPGNLLPIMDYHMQRVLLRMGCIEIDDPGLRRKLLEKEIQTSDELVRKACIDAIKIVAKSSGKGILLMNDYFWPLGRSCCKETTLCTDHVCIKTPCTFIDMVKLPKHETCVFKTVCKGATNEEYRKLWEPMVQTNFY